MMLMLTSCEVRRQQHVIRKQKLPVIDGASVIIIIAWHVSIKLAHAHSSEKAIICDDDLTLVILGTRVKVITCSAKGRDANANTKFPELRLHCLAEAWAPVALSKIEVTVYATGVACLTW
jgi:hypothetical protein